MRADYHVHTAFSDDSDYIMEKVIRDAIAMGLDEVCFTDHVDYGVKRDWDEPGGMLYRKGGVGEPDQNCRHRQTDRIDEHQCMKGTIFLKECRKSQYENRGCIVFYNTI